VLSPRLLVGRALRLRCPVCGGGPLFRRWVVRAERCPTCGLPTVRPDAEVGALALNVMLTTATACAVIVASFALVDAAHEVVVALAAGLGVALVLPIAFYPWSHTLWGAFDLWTRPLDLGEVPPGYELEHERHHPRPITDRAFHRRLERTVERMGASLSRLARH
jgi:uncharacterized protein (DUF983 family)